jgi:2-dehydro-3-deoxygluconokinase/2-dehydro-3-deoxygalactonokinase
MIAAMIDVVALGEPLVQFNPLEEGPLKHAALFEKHAAGSEANVIIGISRLGYKTAYITKLGRDEFSKFILATLMSEDVNVQGVKQIDEKNCGIFFVQRGYPIPGRSDVLYFRSDSATKYLEPEDLDEKLIQSGKIFHVSGITPALSDSCRRTTLEAIRIAKKNGVLVSFDTNYRRKLWTESEAKPTLLEIARSCDFLMTDPDDAKIILGRTPDEPSDALEELGRLGPSTVVYKLGATMGLAASSHGEKATSLPIKVPVMDQIGAGDAVVAGFLAGYLAEEPLQKSLDMASACSALTVMRKGDFENLPDRTDLEKFLAAKDHGFQVDFR